MSFSTTAQTGTAEPMPEPVLELQQIALAMLLIWDALDKSYENQWFSEELILVNWAQKHKVGQEDAHKALIACKERLCKNPWIHFGACRDFEREGWMSVFLMRPNGNPDILRQIQGALDARPFPNEAAKKEGQEL